MKPNGWKWTTLGEICINKGLQTGPFGSQLHSYDYVENGIPVIMPKDIGGGRINHDTLSKITIEKSREVQKHKLKISDIVFGRRGEIGRYALVTHKEKGWICGTGCMRARLDEQLCADFIGYLIGQKRSIYWLNSNAVGQTMLNLNTEILSGLPLLLPTNKFEQEKIAEILGCWDSGIERFEKLIDSKRTLKKGLMHQLLTGKKRFKEFKGQKWKEVRLGDISDIKTGGKDNQNKIENGKYPFFVRSDTIERIDSYSYDGEAILIPGEGRIGEIFHYIVGKFDYHQRVYKISDFSKGVCGRYLYHYLAQHFKQESIRHSVKATVDSLRLPTFKLMKIMLPEIKEQQKIASVLNAADQEIELLCDKLKALKNQKKGLMQKLLTGKIRVKVQL